MQSKLTALKRYFSTRPDVAFAFLFGSQAKRHAGRISDWDIGVYFTPKQKGQIEWEDEAVDYPQENKIWDDLVSICKTEDVDLVVLNRAAAGGAWPLRTAAFLGFRPAHQAPGPGLSRLRGRLLCNFTEVFLAHEYLDVRWQRLNGFIKDSEVHYKSFVGSVKKFL